MYLHRVTNRKNVISYPTCPHTHQTSKVRNITKQLDNLIIILELQINNFSKHLILELEINNKQWQCLRHE